MKIGMVRAGIYKKIEIRKCNKCWGYEHLERNCNNKDMRNCCYKCGASGHIAKDCENTEHCPLCNEAGHRAGTGKCWRFRKALGNARRAEKTGKGDYGERKEGEDEEGNRNIKC